MMNVNFDGYRGMLFDKIGGLICIKYFNDFIQIFIMVVFVI